MSLLTDIVPWGRSFEEYARMFVLSSRDAQRRILGCADGPAAFNAVATARGMQVTSMDPIYRWSRARIAARIDTVCDEVVRQTAAQAGAYRWERIAGPEELARVRLEAMRLFLDDFDTGRAAGRYVEASLPDLPCADDAFDLALCSHFLFLYSDRLDAAFHESALIELCRVAPEVRIFPLVDVEGRRSAHLDPMLDFCRSRGWRATLERVPYEFQRGAHTMLRIRRGA